MLFPEEDAPELKKWIVKRIENTSDADADVLADYVLALLRHDGDAEDVRKLCEAEIPDFLKEDPTKFVSDVFEAVRYKSYLPGAPPPPVSRPSAVSAAISTNATTTSFVPPPQGGLSYDDVPMAQGQKQFGGLSGSQRGSRKRAWEAEGQQQQQVQHNGEGVRQGKRAFKQARRSGRGGRADDNGFRQGGFTSAEIPQFTSGQFDANQALGALFGLGPMGLGGNPFAQQPPPGRRKQRCRDYDTKGYCARGNTCPFQHGDDPVFMPPPPGTFGSPGLSQAGGEEYDPSNALLDGGFVVPNLTHGQPFPPERGQGRRGQKRRPKAPFSTDGPVFDKTKTTIVVENIPEENFTEEQVREFFSQFGNIVEVSMQPYKRLAIVKYDNWGPANAAYRSPKAIFENRFVKVFWFKDDDTLLPQSVPLNGNKGGSVSGSGDAGSPAPVSAADMEEFVRRQEEAQKLHEEKQKKLEEVERQREELEKKQQVLLSRQREEKARLQAKLAKKGTSSEENGASTTASKPRSQSEALRAQLAALEEEAKQLGIDPDSASEAGWAPRGGYAGGRGYYRGRRYEPGGGFRGSFRGRGNHHAAYAMYSLDNRPKKVIVTGVDFTVPEKDETLRQYLFGIGEFTDIQTTPGSTGITFKDRKTAEKFFHGIHLNNKTIPGIDGQVEPSWSGSSSTPPTSTPSTPVATGLPSSAKNSTNKLPALVRQQHQQNSSVDGGGGSVSSDKDVQITLDRPVDQQDMDYEADYDVADENQWDIE